MLAWLALVVLPSICVGWFTVSLVGDRLSERVEANLANVRRLEAARINDELAGYAEDAVSLAAGPHVIDFVGGVTSARADVDARPDVIGGYDGFDVVDPEAERPLTQLAEALQNKARTTGSEAVELRLVGTDGRVYGQTPGFEWSPYDPTVLDKAMAEGRPVFGNAFRTAAGDERLGLVTPIVAEDGDVVGALLLETNLGPIVDLVVEHEGFGETSEAHIAQPTAEGDAEFITLLRFERDAAFNKVVPAETGLPINLSLLSPGGRVVRSPDYRGIESVLAIETLESTGWGLVLKIDTSEAFAPVAEVRRAIMWAGILTVFLIIVGSAVVLNPLGRRLRRLSLAATQIAAGQHHSSIDDQTTDEIGEVARSIDQLAADLATDIEMRTIAERKLRHQATHDNLTGIHNRNYATQQIEQLSDTWSVLFLDLDAFKHINDTHGHRVGDEVLQAVAARLSHATAAGTTVARWGGDEFVVILPAIDSDQAKPILQQVENLFRTPVSTSAGELTVYCSIGLATSEADDNSVDDLMHRADSAMFAEKPGPTRRPAWSPTERTIMTALQEDRIETWFQPIFASAEAGTTLVGAEALVRLRTPEMRFVVPGDFLPAINNPQIARDLDERVTRQAATVTADWFRSGLLDPDFQVSVNVGSASSRYPDLAQSFIKTLQLSGLPPRMLVAEISETAGEVNADVLHELRELGISIAIDDIGISHSNFDRILQIRPRYAKLDRRWMTTDHDEIIVLSSLVEACQALELNLVAEGIETPGQYQLIEHLGVGFVQGFLFGKAVPGDEFVDTWLRQSVRQGASG